MIEMEKVKEDVAKFTASLFGNVLYLVHVRTIDDDNDYYVFKNYDSAEEKFYAEVGRELVKSNLDDNEECAVSVNLEFARIQSPTGHLGQIGYFASDGYRLEVRLYKLQIKE